MDIAGKVFIVTGGASGLGEGTARMLAREGGKVVIADLNVEKGEALAAELGGAFVKADVSQEADAQAVVAKALSHHRMRVKGLRSAGAAQARPGVPARAWIHCCQCVFCSVHCPCASKRATPMPAVSSKAGQGDAAPSPSLT